MASDYQDGVRNATPVTAGCSRYRAERKLQTVTGNRVGPNSLLPSDRVPVSRRPGTVARSPCRRSRLCVE